MPHHQFVGLRELADAFDDEGMMDQAVVRVRHFPDVHDLPDAALRFAFADHVVEQHRPRSVLRESFRTGIEDAFEFVPQFPDLRVVQDAAPVEKPVAVERGDLVMGEHGCFLSFSG